jgi:hypothetical protein
MSKENVVSIQIPENELNEIKTQVLALKEKLQGYLISLKPAERQGIAKMSDKTVPFVEKVTEYVQSHPEFVPPFMQTEEMMIDVKAYNDLIQIFREVEQLCTQLDDTVMLSGSEAYLAALAYYNSVKQAAKMNVPNAKSIYKDLKQRFDKKIDKKQ